MSDIWPTPDQIEAFRTHPREGTIHMLNFLRFRERAEYDVDFDGNGDVTGEEAFGRYGAVATETIAEVGGRIVWSGVPEVMFIGQDEAWDWLVVAEYPTRAAFQQMMDMPRYQAVTVHRSAAVAATRLIQCRPGGPFD